MPIEIRELQINVTVNQPQGSDAVPDAVPVQGGDGKEAIVSQCIEQVMNILKNKKER